MYVISFVFVVGNGELDDSGKVHAWRVVDHLRSGPFVFFWGGGGGAIMFFGGGPELLLLCGRPLSRDTIFLGVLPVRVHFFNSIFNGGFVFFCIEYCLPTRPPVFSFFFALFLLFPARPYTHTHTHTHNSQTDKLQEVGRGLRKAVLVPIS